MVLMPTNPIADPIAAITPNLPIFIIAIYRRRILLSKIYNFN